MSENRLMGNDGMLMCYRCGLNPYAVILYGEPICRDCIGDAIMEKIREREKEA